jgi:putative tryptophan/tyrosine transport system substrate-binding protein
MRRREFVGGLGATLAMWPLVARGQGGRLRKIGVVMNFAEADVEGQARFSTLKAKLHQLGWLDDRDIEISVRWAAGKSNLMLAHMAELVSQPADVIVVNSTPLLAVAKQITTAIPIVFTQVADPIGSGFLTNYARPGGNITGFTDFDVSIAGKWAEILKEAAPGIGRLTVLLAPDQKNHGAFLQVIEAAAPILKLQVSKAEIHSRDEIEQAITALSGQPDRGLIVLPGPLANGQRDMIIQLTRRFHLPAIYPFKYYVKDGGLLYYGAEQLSQWTKAAEYVDRVLKGERPGDLPVQAPTKFELVVNAKAAKIIGLTIPATLLATADEVIE